MYQGSELGENKILVKTKRKN